MFVCPRLAINSQIMQSSTCSKYPFHKRVSSETTFVFDYSHYLGTANGMFHTYPNARDFRVEALPFRYRHGAIQAETLPGEFTKALGKFLVGLCRHKTHCFKAQAKDVGHYGVCRSSHVQTSNRHALPRRREAGWETEHGPCRSGSGNSWGYLYGRYNSCK